MWTRITPSLLVLSLVLSQRGSGAQETNGGVSQVRPPHLRRLYYRDYGGSGYYPRRRSSFPDYYSSDASQYILNQQRQCLAEGKACTSDTDCCSSNCQNILGGSGSQCGPKKNVCAAVGGDCTQDSDCCSGSCMALLGGSGKKCTDPKPAPSPSPPSCVSSKVFDDCKPGTFNPCCNMNLQCVVANTGRYPNDEAQNKHRCHVIPCGSDADCSKGSTCQWGAWRGEDQGYFNACSGPRA